MNCDKDYPIFPLSQPLFPQQVMPLQIFEQRYLDLVSRCLKDNRTFGIVLIREGREVGQPALTFQVGVEARIVDWDQLPNGLLGIKIRGERKFRLESTRIETDKLTLGDVQWLPEEDAHPIPEPFNHLFLLLEDLREHPAVKAMGFPEVTDSRALGWQLTQLLPMTMPERINLLSLGDPIQRLQRLAILIEQLGQQSE